MLEPDLSVYRNSGLESSISIFVSIVICCSAISTIRGRCGTQAWPPSAEAAATVAPRGKQASFASRAYAFYALCEKGQGQPRSLAAAFLNPVSGNDNYGGLSIKALEDLRDRFDNAYGSSAEDRCTMNVLTGEGALPDVISFAVS